MIRKKIGLLLILLLFTISSPLLREKAYASDASLFFYPSSGIVEDVEEGFTVDVLIDSGGVEISKARVVVKYDPQVIILKEAGRNNSLFAQFPDDQSSTDNVEGIVMLTGITEIEDGVPFYTTVGEPDVFIRLKFEIIDTSVEKIVLDMNYSGEDELFESIIITAHEPNSNILLSKPSSAIFHLKSDDIPETAINISSTGIIVGLVLILAGAFVRRSNDNIFVKRRGTVVIEGTE